MEKQAQETDEPVEWGKDILKYLKDRGGSMSQQYGPQFRKYLDKALQHAKPPIDKLKSKMDEFSGVNSPDSSATEGYNNAIAEARQYYKEVIPHTDKLLKDLYNTHTELKNAFMTIDAIAGELKSHFSGGQLYLNEDSANLMNKLEEQKQVIRELVHKMVDGIEVVSDKLGGINLPGKEYKPKFLK